MLKAIEVEYDGYLSRLETRWAIFLATLGVKHEYKARGYVLDGVRYFPTFWLPELDCFLDVCLAKPGIPSDIELLVERTRKAVYVFFGDIPLPTLRNDPLWVKKRSWYEMVPESDSAHMYNWLEGHGFCMDYPYWWCECPLCRKVGIEYSGCSERLCHCYGENADHGNNYASPRLLEAY